MTRRRIVITVTPAMLRAWWERTHVKARMPSHRRAWFALIKDALFGWIVPFRSEADRPTPRPRPVVPARPLPVLIAPAVSRTPIRRTAPPSRPVTVGDVQTAM